MTGRVPPVVAANRPLRVVGCGILHKEVDFLVAKNGWNVETEFLDSALHNYLNRLSSELDGALERDEQAGRDTVVFYGSCHPQMDSILQHHHTLRTHGQNCIVMLLGYDQFMDELGKGAYFLLEDWALTWEPMLTQAFGNNREVLREIFHGSHQYMIAIRTPCSSDFRLAAEAAADYVDLPLRWMNANLDHLESVLAEAIERKQRARDA
jgi:hypothetical protein